MTDYARLVALARAEHERRLATRAAEFDALRAQLAAAQGELSLKPWPKRWWRHLRRAPFNPYRAVSAVSLPSAALVTKLSKVLAMRLVASSLAVALVGGLALAGRDVLRDAIADLEQALRDTHATDAEVVAAHLARRLAPGEQRRDDTAVSAYPDDWQLEYHFAFCYSLEAELKDIAAPALALEATLKRRGQHDELSVSLEAARRYAVIEEERARRLAGLARRLSAASRAAWNEAKGRDLSAACNAQLLGRILDLLDLHRHADRLWRPDLWAALEPVTDLAWQEQSWDHLERRAAVLPFA